MSKKFVLIYGLIVFAILLTLSIIFFKERSIILDMSYQLFHILKNDGFAIQINRFGAGITQMFPLLGSKLGLPLSNLALLYSISFIVFYFGCFLFILLYLKNTRMALIMALFNVTMVTDSFYWVQCELVQGAAYTFVYLALIENVVITSRVSARFVLLAVLLVITMVFIYPLLPFVFLFGLAFLYLTYRKEKRFLAITAISYIVLYIPKMVFFRNPYDSGAMSGLKNIFKLFPDYFSMKSNANLIQYFIESYYMVPLLLIGSTIYYIYFKKYQKLALLYFFFLSLCFIINVSNPAGKAKFNLEPQYLILSFYVLCAFVYDVVPFLMQKKLALYIIAAITLIGLIRIWTTHHHYTNRLNWHRSILAETANVPDKKLIIPKSKVPMNKVMLTWGSSFEFWLLSTIEQGESRSIIIAETPGEFDWTLDHNKAFPTKWGIFEYNELNPKYFIFKDTSRMVEY